MKVFGKIGLILCLLVTTSFAPVQLQNNTPAKIKATFLYNFTRFIEWPESYQKGPFFIGILGETPLYGELIAMQNNFESRGKDFATKGNQPFAINKYLSPKSIGKCHMIYIAKSNSHQIDDVLEITKGLKTLIITENPGLIEKGSGINFVVNNNKLGFELNKSSVTGKGLSLSSSFLQFAYRVI